MSWQLLEHATNEEEEHAPGWVLHELVKHVKHRGAGPNVIGHLVQAVCSPSIVVQRKGLVVVRHLCSECDSFRRAAQLDGQLLALCRSIANAPEQLCEPVLVSQTRQAAAAAVAALEQQEGQKPSADWKARIMGYGNYLPPPLSEEHTTPAPKTVSGKLNRFVGDQLQEVVNDIKAKGAVGTLKDSALDSVDMLADGVGAVMGWLKGTNPDRDNTPTPAALPGAFPNGPGFLLPQTTPAPTAFAAAYNPSTGGTPHGSRPASAGAGSERGASGSSAFAAYAASVASSAPPPSAEWKIGDPVIFGKQKYRVAGVTLEGKQTFLDLTDGLSDAAALEGIPAHLVIRDTAALAASSTAAPSPARAQPARAPVAASSLEQCAVCGVEETEAQPLKQCSRCHQAVYCSAACQRQDFPQHKAQCAALAAKASAAKPVDPAVVEDGVASDLLGLNEPEPLVDVG
mmetsp:Transcript_94502/g.252834  ORF Transcript_94502/g.252834 Transcript_94502/m.252834 type:complete len:457 (-) Transcript_94502:165-1535(-)